MSSKKTSVTKSVQCIKYIKGYRVSPDLLKALAILSDTTIRRSAVEQKKTETIMESQTF